MALNQLRLSLQFGRNLFDGDRDPLARHRAVLTRSHVTRWIRHALALDAEITVRIVGHSEGQQLNHQYRHKDYATNVLTFDYSGAPHLAADIVICAPVVAQEAKEQGKSLLEYYAHLVVHGVLHAQGYDHEINARDADEMEALEMLLLLSLNFDNPYAE